VVSRRLRIRAYLRRDTLRFPEDSENKCSRDGRLALKDLLNRNWDQRLGCKPNSDGTKDFRKHHWFKEIDWIALESKEVHPPFVPDSKKANFDSTHELEELLLEDNPLKARKRKINQDTTTLSAEMRQMEEQFTTYDFRHSHRRSYYPHNQQIASQVTAASSTAFIASRPETPNPGGEDVKVSTKGHAAEAGGSSTDGHGAAEAGVETQRSDAVPMHELAGEKQYLS